MENYHLPCLFFFTLLLRGISSGHFCRGNTKTVNICTDNFVWNSNFIHIDTINVPNFQQTLCECIVSSSELQYFIFKWKYFTNKMTMKFQIKDMFIDRHTNSFQINITGDTKILLSTNLDHTREGACLGVYTGSGEKFNISCKRSSIHSTSQAPTSQQSVSTTRKSKNKENEEKGSLIPVVSAISGLVFCLVIAFVGFICWKRIKKETARESLANTSRNTQDESQYYMTENPMYNMGETCIIGTNVVNENNHVEHNGQNVGSTSCHYESIQETTDGNNLSRHKLDHDYDYAECQLMERN